MSFGNDHGLTRHNQQISNVSISRGRLDDLGWYLCPNGLPRNFIISGGSQQNERYEALLQVLESVIGRLPTIVLHNHNPYMEAITAQIWNQSRNTLGNVGPFVSANSANPVYEPFVGFTDIQVIVCLRQLAAKLGYTMTPSFEKTVRAHLAVLRELSIPISLSGLYYLCQFRDMSEFYNNIMALPCGVLRAKSIWADLGAGSDESDGRFDLFRALINNLAGEAELSAWNTDRNVSTVNCVRAIQENATLVLSVNDMYADLLLTYIAEELKSANRTPFVLLVDGVRINEQLFDYLRISGSGCCCGIVAENAVELMGGDENLFFRLAEKMDCLILFKHATGKTAEILSEVIGRYDRLKAETSKGYNKNFFSILPHGRHNDVRYSTENRFRVMPEEITALCTGQAIIFDTPSDQVIRFNC